MLRDVFVWAYERSCSRYAALRQSLSEPDPFRLRYREALTDAVGGIVRSREPDLEASLHAFAEENIPPADQEAFVELARDTLKRLHEGTIRVDSAFDFAPDPDTGPDPDTYMWVCVGECG